jgi:hypothetical protein
VLDHAPRKIRQSAPCRPGISDLWCSSRSTARVSRTSLDERALPHFLTRTLLVSLSIGCFSLNCDVSTGPGSRPTATPDSVAGLLPYLGPIRGLFDDAIDPEVFATSAELAVGTTDRRIMERLRSSTFVVPVVVVTVTDERDAQTGRMELELVPVDNPVRGKLAPNFQSGESIKVRLGSGSPGFALVRSNQTELVGKRMNLCWGRFVEESKAVEHWHAFSDTPNTKLAIAKAAAIVDFD